MFSTVNGLEYKYDLTAPEFRTAFDFLKRDDLETLPDGWIELDHGVRAGVQSYESFKWNENMFETHDKYFDIQYVVKGREVCGVCRRSGLRTAVPYEEERDITFYEDPQFCSYVLLEEGDFIVLSPEDAHKPRCLSGESMKIKKIVIKVPVGRYSWSEDLKRKLSRDSTTNSVLMASSL